MSDPYDHPGRTDVKLIVTVEPGDSVLAAEPAMFDRALHGFGPARLSVAVAREMADIEPRDHLPRALFWPHEMGEIAATVEYWPPSGVSVSTAFAAIESAAVDAGLGASRGYVMKEHVVLDYRQTWPDGQPTEGLKMISVGRRRPDMTVEEFETHWRTVHGPLALRHHIGMWRYVQDLVVFRISGLAEVDSIAELYFPRVEDLVYRLYDSPEGRKIIAADARKFGGGGDTHFLTETIVHGAPRGRTR